MINFTESVEEPSWHGYCYAISLFAVNVIISLLCHQDMNISLQAGLKVKSAITGFVYRKVGIWYDFCDGDIQWAISCEVYETERSLRPSIEKLFQNLKCNHPKF